MVSGRTLFLHRTSQYRHLRLLMQALSVSISTQTPGTRPNTHVPRGFVTLLLNASDEVERIATRLKRYSEHRRYLKYGCVTAMLRLNNLPRSLWRRRETKQCDTSFSLACCHRTLKHSAIVTASPIESDQPTVVPTAETEGRISPMQCTSLALYARHRHTLQTAAFKPHGGMPLVIKKQQSGPCYRERCSFQRHCRPDCNALLCNIYSLWYNSPPASIISRSISLALSS